MQSKPPMEAFVITLLKNNLPESYYYHCPEHTLYVAEKAAEIGIQEQCTPVEIDLLRTGALWHDTGFINTYNNHEEEGCALARRYLPGYGYTADDIDKVCGMIMATKIPQAPRNKLEEIIADADLEYLGTHTAGVTSENLYRELLFLNPTLTYVEWNQTQISFIQSHHYFTNFCKINREPSKLEYLNKLKKDVG